MGFSKRAPRDWLGQTAGAVSCKGRGGYTQ